MPQMSPLLWVIFPYLMMMLFVLVVITLIGEGYVEYYSMNMENIKEMSIKW